VLPRDIKVVLELLSREEVLARLHLDEGHPRPLAPTDPDEPIGEDFAFAKNVGHLDVGLDRARRRPEGLRERTPELSDGSHAREKGRSSPPLLFLGTANSGGWDQPCLMPAFLSHAHSSGAVTA